MLNIVDVWLADLDGETLKVVEPEPVILVLEEWCLVVCLPRAQGPRLQHLTDLGTTHKLEPYL